MLVSFSFSTLLPFPKSCPQVRLDLAPQPRPDFYSQCPIIPAPLYLGSILSLTSWLISCVCLCVGTRIPSLALGPLGLPGNGLGGRVRPLVWWFPSFTGSFLGPVPHSFKVPSCCLWTPRFTDLLFLPSSPLFQDSVIRGLFKVSSRARDKSPNNYMPQFPWLNKEDGFLGLLTVGVAAASGAVVARRWGKDCNNRYNLARPLLGIQECVPRLSSSRAPGGCPPPRQAM